MQLDAIDLGVSVMPLGLCHKSSGCEKRGAKPSG
jgi:hypothetical protein